MPLQNLLNAKQTSLDWSVPGLIAGVDEAGRGPLAGPVVAAAVILDTENPIDGLADSKKLSAKKRQYLFEQIKAKALCCNIALATAEEIDQMNILQATMLAMRRAVEGLRLPPVKVLIDGNRVPHMRYEVEAIIKGDSKIPAISAASILAKVYRDQLLEDLDILYPQYFFAKHKGYGTKIHINALQKYGPCPHHRKSFEPIKSLINIK